jgi:hypothetical protein
MGVADTSASAGGKALVVIGVVKLATVSAGVTVGAGAVLTRSAVGSSGNEAWGVQATTRAQAIINNMEKRGFIDFMLCFLNNYSVIAVALFTAMTSSRVIPASAVTEHQPDECRETDNGMALSASLHYVLRFNVAPYCT